MAWGLCPAPVLKLALTAFWLCPVTAVQNNRVTGQGGGLQFTGHSGNVRIDRCVLDSNRALQVRLPLHSQIPTLCHVQRALDGIGWPVRIVRGAWSCVVLLGYTVQSGGAFQAGPGSALYTWRDTVVQVSFFQSKHVTKAACLYTAVVVYHCMNMVIS